MQGIMDYGRDADILALQEPWIGKDGTVGKIDNYTVGHSGYDMYYGKSQKGARSRIMWMVRKDRGLKVTIRDDVWKDWDASIMEVLTGENRTPLRIVNIYNQSCTRREKEARGDEGHESGWCLKRVPRGIASRGKVIMVGDFNAKSTIWDNQVRSAVREEQVCQVVERENLEILNNPDRNTHHRGKSRAVLDLALASQQIAQQCEWAVMESWDTGSDHAACRVRYRNEDAFCTSPMSARYRYRDADWTKVEEEIRKEKDERETEWKEAMGKRDWDEIAKILEEVIRKGMEEGIPKARQSWRSKNWFDSEVKEARSKLGKCKRWFQRSREEQEEWKEEEWKEARKDYFRMIRRKKKEMWDKFVGEAEGREMWGVWKMTNAKKATKTPAICKGNETYLNFEQKEKCFREALFPKTGQDQRPIVDRPLPKKWIAVTSDEAKKGILGQGQYKAPGEDEIAAIVVSKNWDALGNWITQAYDGMLKDGIHPRRWKRAIGAIIPKADKEDYSRTKSYRPIALLSTLGKGLEKVVANRLSMEGERVGGLHKSQWGGRKKRGAEEAVAVTMDDIEAQQRRGRKVTLIATDVAQAFPNTSRNQLACTLQRKEVDERIVRWTTSFMTDREVKLRFDSREGGWYPMETGLPQGSPTSPILFNYLLSPLLYHLESLIERKGWNVETPTFIDDLTFMIASDSHEENRKIGEELLEECEKWGKENSVNFEDEKMEWIELGTEEQNAIRMAKGIRKESVREMRWLGIFIDKKLDFKSHVERKIAKGKRVTSKMLRLGKGRKGMGVENARLMYLGCARSVMEYGGVVWWKGQKGIADRMDKVHEGNMRKMGGHFRTSPGGAVKTEARIQPTELRLDHRNRMRGIKAIQQPITHPSGNQLRRAKQEEKEEKEEWRKGRKRQGQERGMRRAIKFLEKEAGKKIENVKLPGKEERWEREIRETLEIRIGADCKVEEERQRLRTEEEGEVIVYGDGSKREGRCGSGIARMKEGRVVKGVSYKLGTRMEVYDAEMWGIWKAVGLGMRECLEEGRERICVRMDNQQAMKRVAVREESRGELLAGRIREAIREARARGIRVSFEWVKGHIGVQGNEEADKLAKQGTETGATDKDTFTSITYLESLSKIRLKSEWDAMRETDPRRGKYYIGSPELVKRCRLPNDIREDQVIISRLRTGHINIANYLHRIGKKETPHCHCGANRQTVNHLLLYCPLLGEERMKVKREVVGKKWAMTLVDLLYTKKGVIGTLKLWKAFEKMRRERGEEENEGNEDEDVFRGWGEIDQENGREMNDEFELAVRGYGE